MHPYVAALVGGALIGCAASLLLLLTGRIAGVSGILGGAVLASQPGERGWRVAFLAGLVGAGAVLAALRPAWFAGPVVGGGAGLGIGLAIVGGLLVGVGTSLGNGCTSGHGVCGVSRLSRRSLVATATFMAAGVATVALLRVLGLLGASA